MRPPGIVQTAGRTLRASSRPGTGAGFRTTPSGCWAAALAFPGLTGPHRCTGRTTGEGTRWLSPTQEPVMVCRVLRRAAADGPAQPVGTPALLLGRADRRQRGPLLHFRRRAMPLGTLAGAWPASNGPWTYHDVHRPAGPPDGPDFGRLVMPVGPAAGSERPPGALLIPHLPAGPAPAALCWPATRCSGNQPDRQRGGDSTQLVSGLVQQFSGARPRSWCQRFGKFVLGPLRAGPSKTGGGPAFARQPAGPGWPCLPYGTALRPSRWFCTAMAGVGFFPACCGGPWPRHFFFFFHRYAKARARCRSN